MAGVAKLAKLGKTLWKGINYLPKKAKQLQTPFYAPRGGQLSKGQKVANCVLKPLNAAANSLPIVGAAGFVGGLGTTIYGLATDDEDIVLKSFTIALKSGDAILGTALGFIVGGPVGAIAGATYGFLSDKSLLPSAIKLFDKDAGQQFEDVINEIRQEIAQSVKNFIGLSSTEQEAQPEEQEAVEEDEQVIEEEVAEEQVEEKSDEIQEEEPAAEQQDQQQDPQPVQGNPPTTNIFGDEINGITTATHKIVKNDCLWNIAKKYLQDANPGKTITDAQILKQVKEFGRINPEIFGENPTLEKLDLIYPENNLKLCA